MVTFDLATSGNFKDICCGIINHNGSMYQFITRQINKPADPKLHPVRLASLAVDLSNHTISERVFGWGTLAYDCRLLYTESQAKEEVIDLAYEHLDLMFLLQYYTGNYISIEEIGGAYKLNTNPHIGKATQKLWAGTQDQQAEVIHRHQTITGLLQMVGHEYVNKGSIRWVDKKTGRECKYIALHERYMSNRTMLENILRLPVNALAKPVNQSTLWLREATRERTSSEV